MFWLIDLISFAIIVCVFESYENKKKYVKINFSYKINEIYLEDYFHYCRVIVNKILLCDNTNLHQALLLFSLQKLDNLHINLFDLISNVLVNQCLFIKTYIVLLISSQQATMDTTNKLQSVDWILYSYWRGSRTKGVLFDPRRDLLSEAACWGQPIHSMVKPKSNH